jgi:tetratricopeptide (TPR) repeat protein
MGRRLSVLARLRNLLQAMRQRPLRVLVVVLLLAPIGLGAYIIGEHLSAQSHFRAAQEALQRYDFAKAQKHLDVCLGVWPSSGEIHFLAARTARFQHRYDEALEHLHKSEQYGYSPEAIELELLLLQGQRGERSALAELTLRAASKDENAPVILEVLIQEYVQTFQMYKAMEALDALLEQQPDNLKALLGRGLVRERLFDFGAAVANYRRAAEVEPENETVREKLAEALLIYGPPQKALEQFEWLLKRQPGKPAFLLGLARCRRQLGQMQEARRLLDQLLAQHPLDASALAERGKVSLQIGNLSKAEMDLRQALLRLPQDREVNYSLYQCLKQQGRGEEGTKYFARCKQIDADLKRLDFLTREVMKRPHDPSLRCEVGEIFLRQEDAREGLHWLETALQKDPGHRPTHQALVAYYERTNQPAQAARHRQFLQTAGAGSSPALLPGP